MTIQKLFQTLVPTRLLVTVVIGLFGGLHSAGATLLITEIQSNQNFSGGSDYFELTNFGGSPVDLSGWVFDDDSANPAVGFTFEGVVIGAGESVIFVEDITAAEFRTWWGIPETVRVVTYSGSGLGLGQNDTVNIFNAAGNRVTSLSYAAGGFTLGTGAASLGGHAGLSAGGTNNYEALIWDPTSGTTSPRYTFAVAGANGAFKAAQGLDVGSPGFVQASVAETPLAPAFVSPVVTYGRAGLPLQAGAFVIVAQDGNPGDRLTITATSKPDWVTINDNGDGTATLSSAPLAAANGGEFTIELLVADNSPSALTGTQTLTLFVASANSAVILNEYNAVREDRWLDVDGFEASTRGDSFFGRVEGNGGNWFELIVLGNGTANSRVDLRGWAIRVSDNGAPYQSIVLSQDPYWANVPAGTILTFVDRQDAGGANTRTAINRVNRLATDGYAWSNIWIGDPFFVDQAASELSDYSISHDDTLFVIENAQGDLIYGPVGETTPANFDGGVPSTLGLSSREVFKLEQDPIQDGFYPDPYFGNYKDGTTSTFGAPNEWSAGSQTQNFSIFATGGYGAPVFTSSPPTEAHVGEVFSHIIGLDRSATLTATRANGTPLPSWLSVSGNTLSGTPGAGDVGYLDVRIEATAGGATTPQIARLTVYPGASSVILNEYNAVSGSNFLGGGDAAADAEGNPPSVARDTFFGRVQGNGGDWFELVVVGNGGRSTVDLRGWMIEIQDNATFPFVPADRIRLSNHSFWAAVPAGTILTFTEDNTANGGLNTQLLATDAFSTLGYQWANIWVGDSALIDQGGSFGFTVSATGEVSGISISSDDTQFLIRRANGDWVFGPAGEGIAPRSGISNTEIFELEGEPRPTVKPTVAASDDPVTEGYDDGKRDSTFGSPNFWDGQTRTQDFTPWRNNRPVFTSAPVSGVVAGSPYAYSVQTSDADGHARTIQLVSGPSWLSLHDAGNGTGTLSGTPTLGNVGTARVVLRVFDGHLATEQAFDLVVNEPNSFAGFVDALGLTGADAGFTVDPVGRGFSNGVFYLTGGHLPSVDRGTGSTPHFVFTRRTSASDVVVVVQWSNDLSGNWIDLPSSSEVAREGGNPATGFETLAYASPETLAAQPTQFFRLFLTQP